MRFSVVLVDGFGNNLFQLSFLYQYARRHRITHLMSVKKWNDQIFGEPIFGGHPRRLPLTLNEIFPNVPYEGEKSICDRDVSISYFKHDNQFHDWSIEDILGKTDIETNYFVFSGWFFNYRYHQVYRYDFIEWLRFSQIIHDRIPKIDYSETISVHARLGSPADTITMKYFDPNRILRACIQLKNDFPNMRNVLVCSENREKFEKYIAPSLWDQVGLTYVFLDEDVEVCLLASTKCAHHCLSNSTLSYMMAYLDPKLPETAVAYYETLSYLLVDELDSKLAKGFRVYPT